jgi:hypothetical protein
MDFSHVFDLRRWRERFRSDQAIREESLAAGRTPDATADEVGSAPPREGFSGQLGPNGQGSGDVGGPGWAGWGA